ncbi:hypothetical protein BXP70_27850 [Hymenobacter crusticola]|uniref:DUF2750 domain-containing protein n=1 Tax=Hymenobacter crusticola TaxID=1770526 RepID=A0A243W5E9_9BACT|nr:hypothetical protein BXP70_27850 [Hymenobacter crusticola]
MNPHKRQAILNLPAPERYGYLLRKVADFEAIWLIRDPEGITMLTDDSGQAMLPVWPEQAFAALLLTGE